MNPPDPPGPGQNAEPMAQITLRSFEQMLLQPGQRVLDLGCGAGDHTLALAHRLGPGGEVHGVDYNAARVAQAQARAQAHGVAPWVVHHHANATALPWPKDFFDASRSERVFRHLLEPERAFDEMLRVTRPGGRLVVVDSDWATLTIDSDETHIERRLVQFHVEMTLNNPFSGRHLHHMFCSRALQAVVIEVWPVVLTDVALARRLLGLDKIARDALAAGAINAEESLRWHASLARAAAQGGFFASANAVLLAASKG